MGKRKRKLTRAERDEKKRRRAEYMTVFVGGKQKRVKRPPVVEGMPVEEFIRANADAVWLHQEEMWECMPRSRSDVEEESAAELVDLLEGGADLECGGA